MITENLPHQLEHISSDSQETWNATQFFLEHVDSFSNIIPEIAQKKESIIQAGEQLIGTNDLGEGFFHSKARSLVFIALAEKYRQHTSSEDENLEESQIISATLEFLVDGYSDDIYYSLQHPKDVESLEFASLLDEFTDQKLTAELEVAIERGLLEDVKKRLKVDSSSEEPFDVRVLDYSTKNSMLGLRPPDYIWVETLDHHENLQAQKARESLYSAMMNYELVLKENEREFSERLGDDASSTSAFIITVKGKDNYAYLLH